MLRTLLNNGIKLKEGRVRSRIENYNQLNPPHLQIDFSKLPPVSTVPPFNRHDNNTLIFSAIESSRPQDIRVGYMHGDMFVKTAEEKIQEVCGELLKELAIACEGDLDNVDKISSLDLTVYCDPHSYKVTSQLANHTANYLNTFFGALSEPAIKATSSSMPPTIQLAATIKINNLQANCMNYYEAKVLCALAACVKKIRDDSFDENIIKDILTVSNTSLSPQDIYYVENEVSLAMNSLQRMNEENLLRSLHDLKMRNSEVSRIIVEILNAKVSSKEDLIDLFHCKKRNFLTQNSHINSKKVRLGQSSYLATSINYSSNIRKSQENNNNKIEKKQKNTTTLGSFGILALAQGKPIMQEENIKPQNKI